MARNDVLARLAVLLTADSAGLKRDTAQAAKAMEGFSKSASSALNVVKGAIATLGLAAIGREIIDTTAQFQKFSAVLSNTLGSNSAAAIALRDIEKFASQTPFAVDELTGSFVKLANQGFKPSTDELRKLGDLASSTGKGFDQLTEAIIDAQVGEFERLKEFGVRAKKQGDQVTFTFKGVETQTKFTSQAIRDYILSLGDAEGVSGAMAKISGTLGGQISNLGDTWTTFLKTIGDGNNGILAGAVTVLSNIIQAVTKLIKTNQQLQDEIKVNAQSNILTELKDLISITDDVESSVIKLTARIADEKQAIEDELKAFVPRKNILGVIIEQDEDHIFMLNAKIAALDGSVTAINDYTAGLTKQAAAQEAANAATKASLGIIQGIEKQLKALEDQKKSAFSTDAIAKFNVKIEELRAELDQLNASRPLTKFGQDQLDAATKGLEFKLPKIDADFSATSGLTSGFPTELPAPNIDLLMNNLAMATGAIVNFKGIFLKSSEEMLIAQQQQDEAYNRNSQSALAYGEIVGDALAQAANGQITFVQALRQATGQILKLFLQQALAAAIAGSLKTAKNPFIGIALAAAAVAAVSGLFRKATGTSGGGGGSAGLSQAATSVTRTSTAPSNESQIVFGTVEFEIAGNKLRGVLDNANQRSTRTG